MPVDDLLRARSSVGAQTVRTVQTQQTVAQIADATTTQPPPSGDVFAGGSTSSASTLTPVGSTAHGVGAQGLRFGLGGGDVVAQLQQSITALQQAWLQLQDSPHLASGAPRAELMALIEEVRATRAPIGAERLFDKACRKAESVVRHLKDVDDGTFIYAVDLAGSCPAKDAPDAMTGAAFRAALWSVLAPMRQDDPEARTLPAALAKLLKSAGLCAERVVTLAAAEVGERAVRGEWGAGVTLDAELLRHLRSLVDAPAPRPTPSWQLADAHAVHRASDADRSVGVTDLQRTVLDETGGYAAFASRWATPELVQVAAAAGVSEADLEAVRGLFARAPVHVRFRVQPGLVDKLAGDPKWRALLETGTSGGNSATEVREAIEARIFGLHSDVAATERPKYGYLNLSNARGGQAQGFGDCTWVLRHDVKQRATVCFGDSGHHTSRRRVGTFAACDHVLLDLARSGALPQLVDVARGRHAAVPWADIIGRDGAWLEVQLFGDLDLARDVGALVIGKATAGTAEGKRLAALAASLGIAVHVEGDNGVSDLSFRAAS